MSVARAERTPSQTDHARLVPLGHCAPQIGLLTALERVPFKMKTIEHSPGEKLAELEAHLLSGGMHVHALEASPHPLVHDGTVAQAWGPEAFASASGVSELWRAATPASVTVLKADVREVLAPYRQRLLGDLTPTWLVVDCDLTGLVVSDQAGTYEGADCGSRGEVGGVAKGYQFARAQVAGPQEPLMLGGFLPSGRTVWVHGLAEWVARVEAEWGRPRRRVEAVEQRLRQAEQALAALEVARAARARPSPRLAARWERAQAEVERLRSHRDRLGEDNAAHPHPRRLIRRLDGGVGDAELLAWLSEQG